MGAEHAASSQQKIGLVSNVCLEGNYRYPRLVDIKSLMDCDTLICGSAFLERATAEQNLQGMTSNYGTQITTLLDKIITHLNSTMNAKVLLPLNPTFILELSDLLLAKVASDVKINVIADSASQVISYANINLESLNPKLQDKIYFTESPLSFDKMIKSGRLEIFENLS